jgi:hypothetical protein
MGTFYFYIRETALFEGGRAAVCKKGDIHKYINNSKRDDKENRGILQYFYLKDNARHSLRKTIIHVPRRTAHDGNGHVNLQASGTGRWASGSNQPR